MRPLALAQLQLKCSELYIIYQLSISVGIFHWILDWHLRNYTAHGKSIDRILSVEHSADQPSISQSCSRVSLRANLGTELYFRP